MERVVEIGSIDLACEVNNTNHHTHLNGVDRLIVRRGQTFTIHLHLKEGTHFQNGDNIKFIAQTGPIPSVEAQTKARFSLSKVISRLSWSATAETHNSTVSLSICAHTNAPVGRYTLILDQGDGVILGEFVLLFNPWGKLDSVYLANEAEREEYVLSQDGLIYRGTPKRITVLPWTFGQFEHGILDICLQILDESPNYISDAALDCSERKNAVYVTRVLSAMINSLGDKGVVVGNWSDDYEDGVKPTVWKDSCSILRQWSNEGCRAVRYGQCWVFAAVACTVSRALGIPCRVITNFGSARDSNGDLIMERFYNEFDENIADDSIWNYHVWVENWMTRPDLALGYEGWQASDPTPQHRSDGVFCCGPASVRAIKEGELTFKFDVPFVYAEVNADVVEYIKLRDGRVFKMGGSTTEIGKSISTKAVGRDEREDITHNYKYPEGSEEERKVFKKANHHNKLAQAGEEPGLHIKIRVTPDMQIGSDFDVYAEIKNNTMVTKSCRVMFYAQAVSYNGTLGETCGLGDFTEMSLASSDGGKVTLRLEYAEYSKAITQDRMIKLVGLLIDAETREFYRAKKTIVLDAPEIIVNILGVPKVGRNLVADLALQNPLPEPLENCVFTIHGANLTDGKPITHEVGTIGPKEFATAKVEFAPKLPGQRKLIIDFASDKLHNIETYENLVIYE
ncbi:protein-glutamine gamma-glutamyltransferase 2a [Danio rerio]|uniref:Protein-glutamine gamma-glutamyltransferase 2 n=1 Tax=Danio rerio TaxID=7955 RepID=Q66L63_DANRE|nr:protein-glutamine gamma-glutamyltransferase 2a [Danio rerio]AAH78420.1 Transglutaminase 2, C polypeptide [Danio rerio]|eukprot:NP_001004647.1 protein-glutamine gamma-glutamyltransferase 2 [Danio rerio]